MRFQNGPRAGKGAGSFWHHFALLIALAAVTLGLFSGLRGFLALASRDALGEISWAELLAVFVVGARLDAAVLGFLLMPAALLLFLPAVAARRLLWLYALLVLLASAGGVLFEAEFFDYYGFRVNYLVLEHGVDAEVLRAVWRQYLGPAQLVTLLALSVASWGLVWVVARRLRLAWSTPAPWAVRWIAPVLALVLLAGAARGSLDHRPINPSLAAIGSNRVANELAASGVFNVSYEAIHWRQRAGQRLARLHEPLPALEASQRVEDLLRREGRFTRDSDHPYLREVAGLAVGGRPMSVVVVVMESFTGRLVGALGGHPALSPEFDALAREGLLWTHCYASGERTVQGLEAVLSSFPPLPGESVVRRPEASGGFSTLASVFAERGYETLFLYGGQGIFDQMRGFFLANGFEEFVEERDFDAPEFRGSWGVSDEDLFRRANREFQRRWERGKPFFAAILTISLHSPWEFPQGRAPAPPEDLVVPPGFEAAELANFLYADYALGEFMREARSLPYARDTLFVFVGDHGVHLRGQELLPSEEYRIPALFLSPGRLPPARIEGVTSQLDVAPTIMGLVGGRYRSPFFGRDVLASPGSEGFAVMIYGKQHYGVRRADRLTVIRAGGARTAYRVSSAGELKAAGYTDAHAGDAADALALVQVAEELVRTRSYHTRPRQTSASR